MSTASGSHPADASSASAVLRSADDVTWRQLGQHLWVGRRRDVPACRIEEGRRFTLIDADECMHPGFRTLEAAQAATGSIPTVPSSSQGPLPTDERRSIRAVFTTHSIVALGISLSLGGLTIVVLRFGAALFLVLP